MKAPKKKILIIGPIPPPFGGVSIHIIRLSNLLKKDFDFDFIDESRIEKKEYTNIRKRSFLIYLMKVKKSDVLYIHSGKNILRVLHIIVGKIFFKKIILTIHSYPKRITNVISCFFSLIFRMANAVVIVNAETKANLMLSKRKYVLKEAFIPPDIESEPDLPDYVSQWILNTKKNHIPIISANASNIISYGNQDLYGLDLCIEVTRRLLANRIPVKFIFVVASTDKNPKQYFKNQSLIKALKLEENFLLINDRLSFVKIIQLSDVVLRPTNTDGDAITIREGLFLNKLVIASDVVKRPENVFLFKNRNIDDLELQLKKVIKLIENKEHYSNENSESINYLRTFYADLIKNAFK